MQRYNVPVDLKSLGLTRKQRLTAGWTIEPIRDLQAEHGIFPKSKQTPKSESKPSLFKQPKKYVHV